jgi:hypothetical protein
MRVPLVCETDRHACGVHDLRYCRRLEADVLFTLIKISCFGVDYGMWKAADSCVETRLQVGRMLRYGGASTSHRTNGYSRILAFLENHG